MLIEAKLLQSLKALLEILSTFAGIFIEDKLVHPEKAPPYIIFKLRGNFTEVTFLQPLKA
jgi:hypothetical protein